MKDLKIKIGRKEIKDIKFASLIFTKEGKTCFLIHGKSKEADTYLLKGVKVSGKQLVVSLEERVKADAARTESEESGSD